MMLGISLAVVAYVLLKLIAGRADQVKPALWVAAAFSAVLLWQLKLQSLQQSPGCLRYRPGAAC